MISTPIVRPPSSVADLQITCLEMGTWAYRQVVILSLTRCISVSPKLNGPNKQTSIRCGLEAL